MLLKKKHRIPLDWYRINKMDMGMLAADVATPNKISLKIIKFLSCLFIFAEKTKKFCSSVSEMISIIIPPGILKGTSNN
jgi:hypothetical protein